MKCNQSCPGFELVLPCPFPTTITITPQAPYVLIDLLTYNSKNLDSLIPLCQGSLGSCLLNSCRVFHQNKMYIRLVTELLNSIEETWALMIKTVKIGEKSKCPENENRRTVNLTNIIKAQTKETIFYFVLNEVLSITEAMVTLISIFFLIANHIYSPIMWLFETSILA